MRHRALRHGGPLREIADRVEHYRLVWEQSFDRLDEYLGELKERERKDKEKRHGRRQRRK